MLLVDIDHVLLPWDDHYTNPYKGFGDWKKVSERYFSRISAEQLELVNEKFPDILWHTTWSLEDMANERFCPRTGFSVRENLHTLVSSIPVSTLPPSVRKNLRDAYWWKLDDVAKWLDIKMPGRIVWADDHLLNFRDRVERVLDHYGVRDDFLLVAPRDGWTRDSINEAADWLKSDKPGGFVKC